MATDRWRARGPLGDFIDRCVLADRIERMAQACIDHPGLVATPEFDLFVDDLRGLSEDLAGAFVRTVHDGLSGNLPTEVQS